MRRAAVLIALALALAGCGKPAPAPPRTDEPAETIQVGDAELVLNRDGSATLVVEVVNRSARVERLTKVTAQAGDRRLSVRQSPSVLQLFTYDLEQVGSSRSAVFVVERPGKAGATVAVTLEFESAEPVTVDATVRERTDEDEEIVEGRTIDADVTLDPTLVTVGDRVVLRGTVTNRGDGALLVTPRFRDADGKTIESTGPTREEGPQGLLVRPDKTVPLDEDGEYSISAEGLFFGATVTVRFEWFNGVAGVGIRPTDQTLVVR